MSRKISKASAARNKINRAERHIAELDAEWKRARREERAKRRAVVDAKIAAYREGMNPNP